MSIQPAASRPRALFETLTFYLVALTAFLLDQFSKFALITAFALGHSHPLVDGFFHLTYVRNFGAAFSLLHGHVGVLGLFAFAITIGLVVYQRRTRPTQLVLVLGLGLLLGGALGNFSDRLIFGYVRDMFDLRWHGQNIFPIFNVADIGVFLGVCCLLLHSFRSERANAALRPSS